MIQPQSIIKTADNSGVRFVRCIRVLGSSYKKWASYGDLIKASAINVLSKSKIKKGQVVNAIVIRCNRAFKRNSEHIKFNENAVVILNDKLEPFGTRVIGPVLKEIKFLNSKVFSLVSESI